MWVELICGLVLCRLVKRFFCEDSAVSDLDSSRFNSLFAVAKRLKQLNQGCKVYAGLRIPDPDSASRKDIDLVLVTNQEALVISVKNNVSGFVSIDKENNWVCRDGISHKTQHLLDPAVAETKKLVTVLEEYLQQRGVALPGGYLSFKVLCPSPSFPSDNSDVFPPEVITYEQWDKLKPEQRSSYSDWIKGALLGGKKKTQESFCEKLHSVLSTAPIWDRLELKDKKYVLGEFLEFKGKGDELEALRKIKRSKVSRLTVETKSILGFLLRSSYCGFSLVTIVLKEPHGLRRGKPL
ncbi:hypothetical protein OROGR_010905 [Orobanche gracilis]